MLWSKNANFFVYVDLVRIRLKIMLSDFAQEKETFLTTKNNFSKSTNIAFSKWLTHDFGQKMPFFLYLHLMKIRLEIMLGDFAGKKKLILTLKKIFQQIALFERG